MGNPKSQVLGVEQINRHEVFQFFL